MSILRKIADLLRSLLLPYQFGFVQGHSYLSKHQVLEIKDVLNSNNREGEEIVSKYEKQMTSSIGNGYGISFAAGRMAFYTLMKALGIGEGDEVILPGFTCSVMPNAVWRTGAKPVFADIDSETFGSSAEGIEKRITSRTKIIVAQHSFGIPCNIQEIVELGKKKGHFVLEDCALTLDSAIRGIKAGNWADAAIFSTDRTKPINTLIGGFLFTKDESLYNKIKGLPVNLPQLEKDHQERLYKRFLFELKYYMPENYPRGVFLSHFYSIKGKLKLDNKSTFLDSDYTKRPSAVRNYPYPAKFPPFLAQLGLFELERWNNEKQRRKNLLRRYLNIVGQSGYDTHMPKAYLDHDLDIVPLRFVFKFPNSGKLLKKMEEFIDVNSIWFRTPVICSPGGPESLGYIRGSCRIAEETGKAIINWPCVIPENWETRLMDVFEKVLND